MAGNIVDIPWGQEKITTTTRREHALGTRGMTPDGRKFRWAFSDGALGAGAVLAAPAAVANHQDMVTAAAALAAQTVTVTLGNTLASLNQYEDGWLMIRDIDGEGHLYRVASNPAAASAASLVVTLKQGDDIREALTASSQTSLRQNEYIDVVTAPTTATGRVVGVAPTEIADNRYFWCQTGGLAAVLINGTVTVGEMVERGSTTAGSVDAVSYAGTAERQILGFVEDPISVTTDYGFIYLTLD